MFHPERIVTTWNNKLKTGWYSIIQEDNVRQLVWWFDDWKRHPKYIDNLKKIEVLERVLTYINTQLENIITDREWNYLERYTYGNHTRLHNDKVNVEAKLKTLYSIMWL